jgi:hypothetical protein
MRPRLPSGVEVPHVSTTTMRTTTMPTENAIIQLRFEEATEPIR